MNFDLLFNFTVDKDTHRIFVERSFDAPVDLVWKAFTDAGILDQWWAPEPYRCITKTMDFTEGGMWHYHMKGPEGDIHWCLFHYERIEPGTRYTGIDAFCDEHAVISDAKPRVRWDNRFSPRGEGSVVRMELGFDSLADLEAIIAMGFREGFTAGLSNLDRHIAAQFELRKRNKPDHRARVSFYLNFPGTTEEAFLFYRKAFRTEFVNGITRLGEAPDHEGQPQMPDHVKNMVLHVELPMIGGAILMGTDAPEEFGFTLTSGNNMHINLETETRDEATRLFNELSEGGTIDMPMQDMFFGAYYGAFKDRYGVNWMVTHQERKDA